MIKLTKVEAWRIVLILNSVIGPLTKVDDNLLEKIFSEYPDLAIKLEKKI